MIFHDFEEHGARMIFHDFEEHGGNHVTKNQGKSDRCPAFAADPA
jgi:hypothetical protein